MTPPEPAPGVREAPAGAASRPAGGSPAAQVSGLAKVYKNGVRAVDGLDLAVEAGEIFALLGPNGAGKSTTIRVLCTLLRPSAGAVAVFGHDVGREPDAVRALLGYVPQEMALDRHLTGRQHVELSARLYRVPRRETRERCEQLLELVGLAERADDPAKTYSGGMKKRLDLACGLIHKPRLLVLDEPTLGLDIQTRVKVWEFVSGLRREGTTVLLTTHYMEEADQLADRIAIIDGGRLQAIGTSADLKGQLGGEMVKVDLGGAALGAEQRQALAEVEGVRGADERGGLLLFVCDSGREAAPRLAARAEELRGEAPRGLSFGPPSLDDVFLKITGHALRD